MKYYTYAYLRKDGTPYYIGKGKGSRATDRHDRSGRNITPPIERIVYLKYFDEENEAFLHEKYMIYVLGRKNLGTGILWNLSDGGAGGDTGYLGSPEHKKLMSEKRGEKNHFYGRRHTSESRARMSKALKGKKPHNKGKFKDNVSPHAIYMREWRKRNEC
jgi:hypothetical protein